MTIFLVIARNDPPKVKGKITAAYEGAHYEYKPDTWFVQSDLTTNDLAEQLGIRTGTDVTTGLAVAITSYSGRGPTDMWEWLTTRWEKGV